MSPSDDRPRPDPVYLHTELRRPGVTLEVLHLEYLEQHPALRYTAFCDVYRRWLATASVTMRQVHKAGENTDYQGEVEKHWYSAPFRLVHREVWVRVTAQVVEVFHLGDRVASHQRSFVRYKLLRPPITRTSMRLNRPSEDRATSSAPCGSNELAGSRYAAVWLVTSRG